jgi:beta-lactamase regulating signal transducer with metallopeptidase domain
MIADLLDLLIRTQLAASAAILALLGLRRLRLPLDPDTRIWLWLIPPFAAFATLLPADVLWRQDGLLETAPASPASPWLGGAVLALGRVAVLHLAFLRAVSRGRAGPAVTGFAVQRIVMPDGADFTPEERALIRSHEWEHISRNDLAVRNLLAALQGVFWFNPLIHIAARELRLDQELACDEAVVRRLGRRRLYAETLLKCHAARPSPLACHWLGRGPHPLETRLAALARRPITEERRILLAAFGLGAGLAAVAVANVMPAPHLPPWPSTQARSAPLPELALPATSSRD